MPEELNTQPVVTETNAQPPAGAEGTNARNDDGDLDALLKVFETETKPPVKPTPEQQTNEPDLKALAGEVQQMRGFVNEAHNLQFKRDMDDTVKTIRGELDPEIFDGPLIQGWLDAQAQQDQRLAKAWVDRHANPKQFEQVKTALAKNFAKKFSKLPDAAATEDRAAVTAALRGASTRAPEGKAPEYGKLSNADFEKEKAKLFGT